MTRIVISRSGQAKPLTTASSLARLTSGSAVLWKAGGQTFTVAAKTSGAVDTALASAVSAGAGSTVYFPAGTYPHASLQWPAGINMKGSGAGRTILNCTVRFNSNQTIGGASESDGMTLGVAGSSEFYFSSGTNNVTFGHMRFRGRSQMWDLSDYTDNWSDSVVCSWGNFHDIVWNYCEFEWFGVTSGNYFNIWFDARTGGGNIYDLTWDHCTFGAKRANNTFGATGTNILIQPSPPEHASDGPRSDNPNWMTFNWSQITHGSGKAAIGGSGGYGFRVTNCDFLGAPNVLDNLDLCDYVRARIYYDLGDDYDYDQTDINAIADVYSTKGWALTDNWLAEEIRTEIGHAMVETNNLENQDTDGNEYHVSAEVLAHDNQLYGI